jgi:hypothetical protein
MGTERNALTAEGPFRRHMDVARYPQLGTMFAPNQSVETIAFGVAVSAIR